MTVKELKEILENFGDDVQVVIAHPDPGEDGDDYLEVAAVDYESRPNAVVISPDE